MSDFDLFVQLVQQVDDPNKIVQHDVPGNQVIVNDEVFHPHYWEDRAHWDLVVDCPTGSIVSLCGGFKRWLHSPRRHVPLEQRKFIVRNFAETFPRD